MTDMTPERIYLVRSEDDSGPVRAWSEDPAPGIGMEPADAIEYVRADDATKMMWRPIAELDSIPDGTWVVLGTGILDICKTPVYWNHRDSFKEFCVLPRMTKPESEGDSQ